MAGGCWVKGFRNRGLEDAEGSALCWERYYSAKAKVTPQQRSTWCGEMWVPLAGQSYAGARLPALAALTPVPHRIQLGPSRPGPGYHQHPPASCQSKPHLRQVLAEQEVSRRVETP